MKKRSQLKGQKLLEPWRDAELFGRAKMLRARPKRYTLMIRKALTAMKICWKEWITAWNNHHHPAGAVGAYQLIDFIAVKDGQIFAILPDNPNNRDKKVDRIKREAKKKLLDERGIPYVEPAVHLTSQEYQVKITVFLRRLKNLKELGY